MAGGCQCSAVAAVTMVILALAAAIATLTSIITAQVPPSPGRNCYRKCLPGDFKTCHFYFKVHNYQTLSRACYDCPRNVSDCARTDCVAADGVLRRITVVNKQMPGPAIQVCVGDRVVVDVQNALPDAGITIHWHGQHMKSSATPYPGHKSTITPLNHPATPHMDGVPGITQCNVGSGASFTYSFIASHPGTHWWHSHSGFQRGDGVSGPFIVREPPTQDPNYNQYDLDLPEHTLMITDWLHITTEDKFVFRDHSAKDDFPDSMLVNGQGPHQSINATPTSKMVPYQRIKVTQGNRYRIRLINSALLNCPITVSVEGHQLTLIATDGNPIVPINTTSLVTHPAERWDVVLKANHTGGSFWVSFMGGIDCALTAAHQFAILEYEDEAFSQSNSTNNSHAIHKIDEGTLLRAMPPKPSFTDRIPSGMQVNTINSACYEDAICVSALRAHTQLPETLNGTTDYTFFLAFDMRLVNNHHLYSRERYDFEVVGEDQQIFTPQINNFSFIGPATPLLLGSDIKDNKEEGIKVCNAADPMANKKCQDEYCECLHMYEIPLGATVELVLIDEGQNGDENHPVHLHGNFFWVLGMDRPNDAPDVAIFRDEVIALDIKGLLKRNFDHPVYKDSVTIPDAGYTIVRFIADNPGYWLLHCHVLFHSMAGMELVIKVGDDEQIPEAPPGFPTCGNFNSPDL